MENIILEFSEFRENLNLINESKKIAKMVDLNGYTPKNPSMSEFAKVCPTNMQNGIGSLADIVWNMWDKSNEKESRELRKLLEDDYEKNNDKVTNSFLDKCSFSRKAYVAIPKGILSKLAGFVYKIDKDDEWLKEYAYHLTGGSKLSGIGHKKFVSDVKDMIKEIKRYTDKTVQTENPNWQGITGATPQARSQYLNTKTSELTKLIHDDLMSLYIEDKELALKGLVKLQDANRSELQRILSAVGYHWSFKQTLK